MLPLDERAGSFRCAFFRNVPRHYAVTLTSIQVHYRDQQYGERRGPRTTVMIERTSNQLIDIDASSAGARTELRPHHYESAISSLPGASYRLIPNSTWTERRCWDESH